MSAPFSVAFVRMQRNAREIERWANNARTVRLRFSRLQLLKSELANPGSGSTLDSRGRQTKQLISGNSHPAGSAPCCAQECRIPRKRGTPTE